MSRSYSEATDEENEQVWDWRWLGQGIEDPDPARGRIYYKALLSYRPFDNMERIYNVGDPVVLNGGGGAEWVAQVVNLFEEHPDEYETRRMQGSVPSDDPEQYKLMRCTLRWFENPHDLPEDVLSRSMVPAPEDDEVYFSDHVEEEGYNCVTDIEGMAWLVSSFSAKWEFECDPDPRYRAAFDKICVVRGFANSTVDNAVRGMGKNELHFLLENPCVERNLHDTARSRMAVADRRKAARTKAKSQDDEEWSYPGRIEV